MVSGAPRNPGNIEEMLLVELSVPVPDHRDRDRRGPSDLLGPWDGSWVGTHQIPWFQCTGPLILCGTCSEHKGSNSNFWPFKKECNFWSLLDL